MRVHLPDINILLALYDAEHQHHAIAQAWFERLDEAGWATCPLTENGFARIIASPKYPNSVNSVTRALYLLRNTTTNESAAYQFWNDSVSLLDTSLFLSTAIVGHGQVTDVYLLGLCQRWGGTLVTLDAGISLDAIAAPHEQLLLKL